MELQEAIESAVGNMTTDMQKFAEFAEYAETEFARRGMETQVLYPINQDAVVVVATNGAEMKMAVASGLECKSSDLRWLAKTKAAAA